MDSEIKKLIDLTTIIKVEDNIKRKVIYENYGSDTYPNTSRYHRNHFVNGDREDQIDLKILDPNWNNKWNSFGNNWNEERQNYRFFYDSFNLFYFSFEQLRVNKMACINEAYSNQGKMLHLKELTGVSFYGMYHHGKKCIDLLKTLRLIDSKHPEWNFVSRFSETRNKLIEHNYNPYNLKLQIDPSIWSLAATDSCLEIHIHKTNFERAFDAYVDYYEDYYQLETIIVDIIRTF